MMTKVKTYIAVVFTFIAVNAFGLTADYLVPVDSPELREHANYPLKDVKFELKEGKLSVSYHLPPELIGENGACTELEGEQRNSIAGFFPVSGNHAEGYCVLPDSTNTPTCMIKYPGMPIDVESRDMAIAANFNGSLVDIKKEIGDIFFQDPAGIITFNAKADE